MLPVNRPHLLFAHGWAFGPSFWDPLRAELAGYPSSTVDLGFFGPESLELPDGPFVAVGHSLGVAWLLRHASPPMNALVSLGGFGRFSVPAGPTRAMRRGLSRDAQAVLRAFHQACGLTPGQYPFLDAARPDRLAQGLDWLLDWDETGTLANFSKPLLALAALDDAVVPETLTRLSFPGGHAGPGNGHPALLADGGHAFPATRARQCARIMLPFLETL